MGRDGEADRETQRESLLLEIMSQRLFEAARAGERIGDNSVLRHI